MVIADKYRFYVEEVRKKSQLLLIKESEVDSLKAIVKQLKETVDLNDSSKEI